MAKYDPLKSKEKFMSKFNWPVFNRVLNSIGWELIKSTGTQRIYQSGKQKIALLKFPKNRWKVEVLVNNRVVDTGGFEEEDFARILAFELALSRSSVLFPSEEFR